MGYASYTVSGGIHDGEECGYAVDTVCDAAGCDVEIDRGLAFLCGQEPGGSEDSCGGYFCAAHLYHVDYSGRRCGSCADELVRRVRDARRPWRRLATDD